MFAFCRPGGNTTGGESAPRVPLIIQEAWWTGWKKMHGMNGQTLVVFLPSSSSTFLAILLGIVLFVIVDEWLKTRDMYFVVFTSGYILQGIFVPVYSRYCLY